MKNEKPLHQVEKLIHDTPSDNKQEIVEKTPVNIEIASVNIKDDKTVIKKECDDTVNQAPVINFPVFNTNSSQQSLARFIVENNLITLVPQQGAFIVNGQKGKYCVTLFPKETCQCVSTSTCYHILAAKMSIGLEAIQKNRVVNLRALSKNSKKKIDKKSWAENNLGPVNDYEIEFEPAPDSAFTLNTPLKQNVMKTPSTVGSVKPTPQKMNDVSTQKSKRKIDLSAIVEEENDTELPDIINVTEKIDDINSNKSLPMKKR